MKKVKKDSDNRFDRGDKTPPPCHPQAYALPHARGGQAASGGQSMKK
jgi:hypothetical protein